MQCVCVERIVLKTYTIQVCGFYVCGGTGSFLVNPHFQTIVMDFKLHVLTITQPTILSHARVDNQPTGTNGSTKNNRTPNLFR